MISKGKILCIKNRPFFETFADIMFFVWLIIGFLYEYTAFGRAALFIFAVSVGLLILFKTSIYERKKSHLSAFNLYFISYAGFLIYTYWHMNYSGMVINYSVASKMFGTICLNGVFYYLVYKYCIVKNDIKGVLQIYLMAYTVILLYFLLKVNVNIFSGRLGTVIGINSNSIALCCINCALILLYDYAEKRKSKNIILIAVMIFFILISGSRKGILGVAVGFILYACLGGGIRRIKNFIIAAATIVILYFLIMNVDVIYNIIGVRLEELLSFFVGGDTEEASLYVRNQYNNLGWSYVSENPWYGYGLDCFKEIKGAYSTYSHNNYLELMFSVGTIGTALYYFGYIYILFGHIKMLIKYKAVESKLFIVIIVTQMILEYAFVSYFSRQSIVLIVMGLASLRLMKNKFVYRRVKNV